MTPEEFVRNLRNVKKRGHNKWLCSCPSHNDDDPSLSVTTTPTGKILLHCFAGCSALQVVESMGLKLEDLFPDAYQEHPFAWAKREIAAREKTKEKVNYARTFLAILTAKLRDGEVVDEVDVVKAHKLKAFLEEQGAI